MFVCSECGLPQAAPGRCPLDGTALAPIGEEVLLGTTVSAYRVARLLGVGGMGRVYKGVHPAIGSRVAIKVLSRECADRRDLVERFFAEAKAVNLIRHESIVNVLDLAMLPDGRPYIIMEYLDGAPLSALVSPQAPLPLGGLARLAVEVLDALGAAHAKGVVHRDLKPDNIFVTPSGRPKVLDFGIAKLDEGGMSSATRTGSLLGTPHYMSPEQATGQPVDHRTDLYAMGVILFECATGGKPFLAESLFDLLRQHVEAPPPSPRVRRPDMPASLEQVILTALAKAPDHRFHSAAAMSMALQQATQHLPPAAWAPLVQTGASRGTPSGAMWSGHGTPAPTQPTHPPTHAATPVVVTPRRSKRAAWIGVGAVLLAGIGIGGAVAVGRDARIHEQRTSAPVVAPPAIPMPDIGELAKLPTPDLEAQRAMIEQMKRETEQLQRQVEPLRRPRVPVPPQVERAEPAGGGGVASRGAWVKRQELRYPGFDPRRVDVAAFVRWAVAEAKREVPDAQLFRIDVDTVGHDGIANLALADGSIDLRFRSASRSKLDPSAPVGVPQKWACELRVEADKDGVEIRPVDGFRCDREVPISTPRCTPVALWKKAVAQGAPRANAFASLGYRAAGRKPKWYFDIGSGMDKVFSTMFEDDC